MSGDHWRPVQTCSFGDLPPPPPSATSCNGNWKWSTYGFQAGGTHPTGMLSCFSIILLSIRTRENQNILFYFIFKSEDINPFGVVNGTPVLDFWWGYRLGYRLGFGFQTRWLHCAMQNMFTLHRPGPGSLLESKSVPGSVSLNINEPSQLWLISIAGLGFGFGLGQRFLYYADTMGKGSKSESESVETCSA